MPDSESSTGPTKRYPLKSFRPFFGKAGQKIVKSPPISSSNASATGPMLPAEVESKVEQYLKKRCRQPAARKKRAAARDCRTASDARIERVFSAKTTASASAASAGSRPASGKPIRSMVLRPEATRVSARSLAPVKSSATDPKRRDIIGLLV